MDIPRHSWTYLDITVANGRRQWKTVEDKAKGHFEWVSCSFAEMVEDSGRQCKTVENSGRQKWASDTVPTHVAKGHFEWVLCGCTMMVADLATLELLWKTMVDSARQGRTVEDSGRDLPTLYVVWQTVVDSGNGRQWKTVENKGRQ